MLAMPRVLVIDDEVTVRISLRFVLEDLNLTIDEAPNGQEGLDLARRHRPDLILCDLDMPVMDGFETLAHVRRDPALQRIPFVVVTGKLNEGNERRARQAGAEGVLDKPFSCETVQHLVRARLRTATAPPPQPGSATGQEP